LADDSESQLVMLAEMNREMLAADAPWSEVTKARIVVKSVHFITKDVALVDAENTQYGSTLFVRRLPVLLVVKRAGLSWRIAAYRFIRNATTLP
jgi:hypothetical protein